MAQKTVSSALTRLRPINQPNIGGIIEEWTRYWSKNRDEKEAKELARKTKENEFLRQAQEKAFEKFEGLQPEDNAGFLQSQIVSRFEENKPYYVRLAKAAAAGNMDAKLKLADEKRKIGSVVSANKIYAEKIKELETQRRQGIFNPQLDSEVKGLMDSFRTGKYRLNADWSLDAYSPGLKGTPLSEEGVVRLSAAELLSNDFLNSTFHKKASFKENGSTIADNILDTVDGNKIATNQTRLKGIRAVKTLLSEDSIESQSFILKASKDGKLNIQKPLSDFNETDLNIVAEKYYDENVVPFIQEVDNSLANQAKRISIAESARDLKKSREEDLLIAPATDEQGRSLAPDLSNTENDKIDNLLKEGGKAFVIKNGIYNKGESETEEVVGGVRTKDNNLVLVLKREVEKPIVEKPKNLILGSQYRVRTDRGEEILKLDAVQNNSLQFIDSEEQLVEAKKSDLLPVETGKTKKFVETRIVEDDKEINAISSDLGPSNTQNLFEEVNKAIGQVEQLSEETQGLVDEGNEVIEKGESIKQKTKDTAQELRQATDKALDVVKQSMSDDAFEAFLKKNGRKTD